MRREIDVIDDEILRLLNLRVRAVLEAGRIKRTLGRPLFDGDREAEILNTLCRANTGPLGDEAIERIFRRIIDESKLVEQSVLEHSVNCSHSG